MRAASVSVGDVKDQKKWRFRTKVTHLKKLKGEEEKKIEKNKEKYLLKRH